MSSDSRMRQHDLRGRGADDVVGRGPEDATRETPEDTARIKSEIARTREDMSETIDAIQDKLSPRNLVSQAKESVKEATVGRVKQAARSVGQSASGIAEQTREAAADVAGSVRSNPWPALLIGAGTAWILFDRARNKSRDRSYHDRSFDSGDVDRNLDYDAGATSYYQQVRTRGAYGYDTSDAAGSARTGLRQASSQVQDLLERNPLVVGAVAAAVGVAIGLAIPETDRENQLMGETRDTLVERAQGAAQGAVKRAKQVAGEAATQAASEAAKAVTGETANKS